MLCLAWRDWGVLKQQSRQTRLSEWLQWLQQQLPMMMMASMMSRLPSQSSMVFGWLPWKLPTLEGEGHQRALQMMRRMRGRGEKAHLAPAPLSSSRVLVVHLEEMQTPSLSLHQAARGADSLLPPLRPPTARPALAALCLRVLPAPCLRQRMPQSQSWASMTPLSKSALQLQPLQPCAQGHSGL